LFPRKQGVPVEDISVEVATTEAVAVQAETGEDVGKVSVSNK
jgi:hypothetical protein